MFGLFKKSLPGPVEAEKEAMTDATKVLEKTFSEFEDEIMHKVETAEGEADATTDVTTPGQENQVSGKNDAPVIDPQPHEVTAPHAKRRPPFASSGSAQTDVPQPTSILSKYRDLAFGGPFSSRPGKAVPHGGAHSATPPATTLEQGGTGEQDGFAQRGQEVNAFAEGLPARGAGGPPTGQPDTSALNPSIVQALELQNDEDKRIAPTMVATPPDQMIGQAAGLAAQSAAQYFDSMTKLVMASQSVMLKKMAQDVAEDNIVESAEDGLIIAETELLLAGAMAVAAAGGAMEADAAAFGISKINESVATRTGGNST